MPDPYTAALAIPPALDAALNLISRIKGDERKRVSELRSELSALNDSIGTALGALHEFSFVAVDLRPWKYAHHATNLIIHKDFHGLFAWDRNTIAAKMSGSFNEVLAEMDQARSQDSFSVFLMSKRDEDLALDLPQALSRMKGGDSWHEYLLKKLEELETYLNDKKDTEFNSTLREFRQFSTSLNQAADSELLKGLENITAKLDDVRSAIPERPANAG